MWTFEGQNVLAFGVVKPVSGTSASIDLSTTAMDGTSGSVLFSVYGNIMVDENRLGGAQGDITITVMGE